MRKDMMCKHDVINIQYTQCDLQEVAPSVRCLQRVFLRAVPKAACEPHCLSLTDVEQPQLVCKCDVIHKQGDKHAQTRQTRSIGGGVTTPCGITKVRVDFLKPCTNSTINGE